MTAFLPHPGVLCAAVCIYCAAALSASVEGTAVLDVAFHSGLLHHAGCQLPTGETCTEPEMSSFLTVAAVLSAKNRQSHAM